ncbi:hypothetical protein BDB01DRAFT_791049 [Pilobolus umbonatus]|nr:hypothetical protein BDB01DRAFT_791049 [Pilobolus umbonatus]
MTSDKLNIDDPVQIDASSKKVSNEGPGTIDINNDDDLDTLISKQLAHRGVTESTLLNNKDEISTQMPNEISDNDNEGEYIILILKQNMVSEIEEDVKDVVFKNGYQVSTSMKIQLSNDQVHRMNSTTLNEHSLDWIIKFSVYIMILKRTEDQNNVLPATDSKDANLTLHNSLFSNDKLHGIVLYKDCSAADIVMIFGKSLSELQHNNEDLTIQDSQSTSPISKKESKIKKTLRINPPSRLSVTSSKSISSPKKAEKPRSIKIPSNENKSTISRKANITLASNSRLRQPVITHKNISIMAKSQSEQGQERKKSIMGPNQQDIAKTSSHDRNLSRIARLSAPKKIAIVTKEEVTKKIRSTDTSPRVSTITRTIPPRLSENRVTSVEKDKMKPSIISKESFISRMTQPTQASLNKKSLVMGDNKDTTKKKAAVLGKYKPHSTSSLTKREALVTEKVEK